MSPKLLFSELLTDHPAPEEPPAQFHPSPCNHGIPAHMLPGANVCHGCEPEVNREL